MFSHSGLVNDNEETARLDNQAPVDWRGGEDVSEMNQT